MATTLLILLILTIYHFVYESILMPACRLRFRYSLFKNRDEIIKLKTNGEISDEVFNVTYNYINSAISRLPYLRLSLYMQAKKEFDVNNNLRIKVENRMTIINNCDHAKVVEILDNVSSITFASFLGSFGSFFLYLLPIVLLVWLVQRIFSIANGARKLIQASIVAPEKDFTKMACFQ